MTTSKKSDCLRPRAHRFALEVPPLFDGAMLVAARPRPWMRIRRCLMMSVTPSHGSAGELTLRNGRVDSDSLDRTAKMGGRGARKVLPL